MWNDMNRVAFVLITFALESKLKKHAEPQQILLFTTENRDAGQGNVLPQMNKNPKTCEMVFCVSRNERKSKNCWTSITKLYQNDEMKRIKINTSVALSYMHEEKRRISGMDTVDGGKID